MSALAPGAVGGGPRRWLRLEGVAVLALALLAYGRGGHGWGPFALFVLAPDLAFLAYLAGPRVGAAVYNAAHSHVGPAIAAAVALLAGAPPIVACIWAAHVGLDRALGYGLKYPTAFGDTHLGAVGRGRRDAE